MNAFEFHIERLTLEGVTPDRAEQHRFKAAIEAELSRLLSSEPSIVESGSATHSLRAADVRWTSGERTESLGERVGQAVYGSLRP